MPSPAESLPSITERHASAVERLLRAARARDNVEDAVQKAPTDSGLLERLERANARLGQAEEELECIELDAMSAGVDLPGWDSYPAPSLVQIEGAILSEWQALQACHDSLRERIVQAETELDSTDSLLQLEDVEACLAGLADEASDLGLTLPLLMATEPKVRARRFGRRLG